MRRHGKDIGFAGATSAYFAWAAANPELNPVDPAIAGLIIGAVYIALGLWRAWADDGKITPDEVGEILGIPRGRGRRPDQGQAAEQPDRSQKSAGIGSHTPLHRSENDRPKQTRNG